VHEKHVTAIRDYRTNCPLSENDCFAEDCRVYHAYTIMLYNILLNRSNGKVLPSYLSMVLTNIAWFICEFGIRLCQ